MFTRGVDTHVRSRQESKDRAYVGDPSAVLLPHNRENCLTHSKDAEEVGFKYSLGLLDCYFFDSAEQGVPGAVDQRIYSTGLIEDGANAGAHRFIIANVQVDQVQTRWKLAASACSS